MVAVNFHMSHVSLADIDEVFDAHHRELNGYCYRMLGSSFEADDAVQETMVRAWRAAEQFEGRSSVRSWLYRIATNVCLDMLRGRQRRARPMDLGGSSPPEERYLGPALPEHAWVTPAPDRAVLGDGLDPADEAALRESVRLAFITALQHLPPRQRAAVLLCDVLRWQAAETADLLETSVAAVNSALQRARATLGRLDTEERPAEVEPSQAQLLAAYVDAFERYDIPALVNLLHEDAVQSMPPYAIWLHGAEDIGRWMLGPGIGCEGSRLLPAPSANGCPAFGQYRVDPAGGHAPWGLHVLEISGGKIAGFTNFLDSGPLFATFGLPAHL
jgi:RNA polymerase sigma-70 factor, ECF subfamily